VQSVAKPIGLGLATRHISSLRIGRQPAGACDAPPAGQGGSSTLENQTCACSSLALRFGMQGSRDWIGIGRQAIKRDGASAANICRAAKLMRKKLIPRFRWGSACPRRPARLRAKPKKMLGQNNDGDDQPQPIDLLMIPQAEVDWCFWTGPIVNL